MSRRSVLALTLAITAAGALAAPIAFSSVAPDAGARKLQDRLAMGAVMPLPAGLPTAPTITDRTAAGAAGKADFGVFREARLHLDAAHRDLERTVTLEIRTGRNVSDLVRVPISDLPVR